MSSTRISRVGRAPGSGAKEPCVTATTLNITLSGEQTIDDVAVVNGDRVLVKNQTDASENGIYVASISAWSRAPDWNRDDDVVSGTLCPVEQAGAGVFYLYRVYFTGASNIGTTEYSFFGVVADNTSVLDWGFIDGTPEDSDDYGTML